MTDDEIDVEALQAAINRLEMKFQKLAEDYTDLRHEVNELENKLERRT